MKDKIQVYHFNNGTGGGVLSVIRNLLAFSQDERIENHVIYILEKGRQVTVVDLPRAKSIQHFTYDKNWNFYYTCKQLAKLLPDEKAVIVAHDWLELGMCSHLGLQNPVVQFLHGDFEYYYQLAEKHRGVIDYHLCVSPVIEGKLKTRQVAPERIYYRRFPVPQVNQASKSENVELKIIYCVRDLNEERKQFDLLPEINDILLRKQTRVHWTIIGSGKSEAEIKAVFGSHTEYFPRLGNAEVYEQMLENDLFILPSTSEGFPVAVVEAMKCGLVPLVTNWEGATKELVIEEETGYYFRVGDAKGYASQVESLNRDREKLKLLSKKAQKRAESLFDPFQNTKAIEQKILKAAGGERLKKIPSRIYGSRLDKKWIPNALVRTMRKSKIAIDDRPI